mmetsp:Transcript_118016/g.333819  ORF Transcript_118016/g.333819 Transcript_118016/m.333819 type:complete len:362 (+) Transcript_118016:94-1179(+)
MAAFFALLAAASFGLVPSDARLGMTLVTLEEAGFDAFVQSNDRVMVDFYDPDASEWPEQERALRDALKEIRGYGLQVPIGIVDAGKQEALAKRFVPNGRFPQLLWFMHGKPTGYHRTLRSTRIMVDFILALDRSPITEVKTMEEVFNFNPAVLAEIPKNSPMYKTLEVVAQRHMDQVAFTVMDSSKGTISWYTQESRASEFSGAVREEALDRWVREQLPMKSEPVPDPEASEDAGSKVVVAKTFEDIVLRPDKDVILLIYADWCGYCKQMKPAWESLAGWSTRMSHLVVAKMDGDRNGSPLPNDFLWNAYPTIFYVRAGSRDPITYSGNRTLQSLAAFATEHSSKPLDDQTVGIPDGMYDL